MITLGRRELQDIETALGREWLETNGLGGYASSTVLGVNTRKYHGLLTAALRPPTDRVLLVSHVDEALLVGESRFELAASEYEGTVYPDGFRYLDELRLDPFPVFTYVAGSVRLRKSVFMIYGENTTCLVYEIDSLPGGPKAADVRLEVRPIVAFREHQALMRETEAYDRRVTILAGPRPAGGCAKIRPLANFPPLYITFSAGRFAEAGYWYRNYHYRREKEVGYAANEDLYSPGTVTFGFEGAASCCIAFSTSEEAVPDPGQAVAETQRRAAVVAAGFSPHQSDEKSWGRDGKPRSQGVPSRDDREADRPAHRVWQHLALAADAFIVRRREGGRSIIAGYPWFADWGRDTMLSLPGLALATGRHEDARRILDTYAANMNHGLVPNLFAEFSDQAQYNTLDATLWFFEAVRKYYDATGDGKFVASILPRLKDAARAHIAGTVYGIGMDDDCLLRGGAEGVQLTWMDAKYGDRVITARAGKPVEINALWYNALRIMADFCGEFGGLAEERKYDETAAKAARAFNRRFWNDELGCLYDCVDVLGKDDSIRPNQVIAVSLTYPVLDPSRWKSVVDLVERELLTPYGLRTLSPNDPRYRGTYQGNLEERDNAYHQGTVWPWLLGPYVKAYLRAHGSSERTLSHCARLLEPFVEHLREACLGQISEIFDGDPPHTPRGCVAQAWSVAELLRIMAEDLSRNPRQAAKSRR